MSSLLNFKKLAGISAIYLALANLIGIIIFLVVLDYPSIVDPSQKMAMILNNQMLVYLTNMLSYVIWGIFFAVLVICLYYILKNSNNGSDSASNNSTNDAFKISSTILPIATVIGIIWAILLIASGLIANAGIAPAVVMFQQNPAQAALFYSMIETVADGLGGVYNGELFGGLVTLLISFVALGGKVLPKGLNYWGLLVGAIGLISVIPGLHDFSGIFGIGQIIWFICLGITLIKE